jgi:hypothetical protein
MDLPSPLLSGGSVVKSIQLWDKALAVSVIVLGVGMANAVTASADDTMPGPALPGPVQVAAPTADDADPAAVAACAQFAQVLDGSATYYGDFADSFEGSSYADPAVSGSNVVGRTALREAAGLSMDAANTAGLAPDIADPMRVWSLGATKLLVKMGLRISGESLNSTATEMNNQAVRAQEACAAAGTHA